MYLLTAVTSCAANVMYNIESYGQPIVLFRRHPLSKRIDSFIIDLFAAAFILGMGYANIKLCIDALM